MAVPSGYTALGLVGFTDKGEYSASSGYSANDIVRHQDTLWRCLLDGTEGIVPSECANWTVFIRSARDPSAAFSTTVGPSIVIDADAAAGLTAAESVTLHGPGAATARYPRTLAQEVYLSDGGTQVEALLEGALGPAEMSGTAASAHAIWSYFRWGGAVAQATGDIAIGDAIAGRASPVTVLEALAGRPCIRDAATGGMYLLGLRDGRPFYEDAASVSAPAGLPKLYDDLSGDGYALGISGGSIYYEEVTG